MAEIRANGRQFSGRTLATKQGGPNQKQFGRGHQNFNLGENL
jgi:hypothetical protein